jgi:hypothetical protein
MAEKIVFGIVALLLVGAVIVAARDKHSKLSGKTVVVLMLILAATYRFRFGDLSSFTLKAFSSEAQFDATQLFIRAHK